MVSDLSDTMKKAFVLVPMILFFTFCSQDLCGQEVISKDSLSRKNALSLSVAGATPFIGVSYETLISDRIGIEGGLGILSFGGSIKYFVRPVSENLMVPHLALGTNLFSTPFDTFGSGDFSSITYGVIGLTYLGKGGFNFGLEAGISINYDFTFNETTFPPYGSLRLGYRLKNKKG